MEVNDKIKKFNVEMMETKNNCAYKPLLIGVDTDKVDNKSEDDQYIINIMDIFTKEWETLELELRHSGIVDQEAYIYLNNLYNCSNMIKKYLVEKEEDLRNCIQALDDAYIKNNSQLMIYICHTKDIDQTKNMLSCLAAMLTCHQYLHNEALKTIVKDEKKTVPYAITKKKFQKSFRMPE